MASQRITTKKIRVLFVLIQLDAGGSERVVLDLACNLDRDIFEVYVAAFKGGVLESSFKEVCKELFVITKKPGFDMGAMLKISSIIKEYDINVINAHHYMPCFYSFVGCCIMQRKRLIYTGHSVPEVLGVADGKHRVIFNIMLNRIDTVIGVSREITDTFKKHYPKHGKKFKLVVNGVDIDKFRCPEKRGSTRKQFGFESHHFVVGMVANFRKVKNHGCLIRAVSRLRDAASHIKVLLVGTGFPSDPDNTEKDIKQLVKDLDLEKNVIFAGYQSDIPAMLSAMDCFCLPSFSEGLPVSVLEAMAAGLVVVGSDVSGIKEIIEDGVTGHLFGSDKHQQLCDALTSVCLNNFTLDGESYENFVKCFGKSKWINEMQSLYSGVSL